MKKRELRSMLFQLELSRRRLLQPWFSGLGLTLGQGQPRILARLLQGDGLTQRELADACVLAAMNMADLYFKEQDSSENLRRQIKDALETNKKLEDQLSESRREIFKLQNGRR